MANRILARHDDGTLAEQSDGEMGYEGAYSVLRIERSAAGAPGLFFVIEDHHGNSLSGETSVYVPDGNALLAPVLSWLAGNRDTERHAAHRNLREHFAAHLSVAAADNNLARAIAAKSLMGDVNLLNHGERTPV